MKVPNNEYMLKIAKAHWIYHNPEKNSIINNIFAILFGAMFAIFLIGVCYADWILGDLHIYYYIIPIPLLISFGILYIWGMYVYHQLVPHSWYRYYFENDLFEVEL